MVSTPSTERYDDRSYTASHPINSSTSCSSVSVSSSGAVAAARALFGVFAVELSARVRFFVGARGVVRAMLERAKWYLRSSKIWQWGMHIYKYIQVVFFEAKQAAYPR
jgi:hypothetical protein